MRDYWFARYSLPPQSSRGLVPVRWQGWAVIAGFVSAMIGGGLAMLLLGLADQIFWGVMSFAALAIAGGATFIGSAVARSDPKYTIDDYRSGRVPGHLPK